MRAGDACNAQETRLLSIFFLDLQVLIFCRFLNRGSKIRRGTVGFPVYTPQTTRRVFPCVLET